MKRLLILLFIFFFKISYSQTRDTIQIDYIDYVIIIDTIDNSVKDYYEVKKETFFDNIYIGTDIQKDGIEQKILYDITDYSKISLGYDIKYKRMTLGVYISFGKIIKREYNIKPIYF